MDKKQIETKVIEIISTLLKQPLDASASRASLPQWDSLKQVEIIFTLEEEFDLVFEDDELAEMNSISAIVARVMKDAQ